jgi:hypothetical protein
MDGCGKKAYLSYSHAANDARTVRKSYGEAESVYRCRRCGAWHVGHTERLARRTPRRTRAWHWRTAASEQ